MRRFTLDSVGGTPYLYVSSDAYNASGYSLTDNFAHDDLGVTTESVSKISGSVNANKTTTVGAKRLGDYYTDDNDNPLEGVYPITAHVATIDTANTTNLATVFESLVIIGSPILTNINGWYYVGVQVYNKTNSTFSFSTNPVYFNVQVTWIHRKCGLRNVWE